MTKICVLAGNFQEALTWAKGQMIPPDCWFYPTDPQDLLSRENFHVIVIGTAGQNIPPSYFEKIYSLAQQRGAINRR